MKKVFALSVLLLLIALPCVAQEAATGEKVLKKSDLPQAILTAFEKAYPTAKIIGCSKETQKDTVVYEIESKDSTISRDIAYDENGNVLSIEEVLPFSALPKAVQDSVINAFPKYKVVRCEKEVVGTTTKFELLLKSVLKRYDVVFDSDGKLIEKEVIPLKKIITGEKTEKKQPKEVKEPQKEEKETGEEKGD